VTNRYWPRQLDEIEGSPTSLINEPALPPNVATLAPKQRSIHAMLVENLNSTQALLTRLESGRVCVPRQEQREVLRETYVACRRLVQALEATLELEGIE
jgi:hypothetical protein